MFGKKKKIDKVLNGQLDSIELTKYDIAMAVVDELKLKHSLDMAAAKEISHDLTLYQRMSKFEGKQRYDKESLELQIEIIRDSFLEKI